MNSLLNSGKNIINSANNAVAPSFKKTVPQQGNEQRTTMLPTMVPSDIGPLGSSYSPADAMKTPGQIGVKVGDSMGDVINAVKGVGFYMDQIGFGAPSTGLTSGMPLQPLGVNYFLKTGVKCSNGADMWQYIKGITEGDALGQKVKNSMEEMGLPPLKGLAPGMIEDMKYALNPEPLISALFGSGYPQCKQVTYMVGDSYGNIRDSSTGESWISNPELAIYTGNGYVQTRWVQDTDRKGDPINLSRDQWLSMPKTFNPDGSPNKQYDTFEDIVTSPTSIITIGILCVIMLGVIKRK
jgi:hypothetical protein